MTFFLFYRVVAVSVYLIRIRKRFFLGTVTPLLMKIFVDSIGVAGVIQ